MPKNAQCTISATILRETRRKRSTGTWTRILQTPSRQQPSTCSEIWKPLRGGQCLQKKKIQDLFKIPNNNGLSLRKYSDFHSQVESAITSSAFLNVLNDPEVNKRTVSKISGYLFIRWVREVDQRLTTDDKHEGEYPPFSAF